jgi:hypothetical protein
MTAVRPKISSDAAFCAIALTSPLVRSQWNLLVDSGTLMDALNVHAIRRIRLPGAEADHRLRFSQLADPLLELSDHGLSEIDLLKVARDALLPKLLSGEITVRLATSVVDEAV